MGDTQKKRWSTSQINNYEQETKQALLRDQQTLVSFSQDFGKLVQSTPTAVCIPQNKDELKTFITFASEHQLPITIRGNGLSQGGQSLPIPGGVTLSMQHFNQILALEDKSIWVEANASWESVLSKTLPEGLAPYVLPYNCNLAVAGVLSVGGVGAASFKYGTITAHVQALEVIDGTGRQHIIDKTSPLFHACLSGQGQFAVITQVKLQLRPIQPKVQTACLVYVNQEDWFTDWRHLKNKADYLEVFASPSLQGAILEENKRTPTAQWLYGLHCSFEYDEVPPWDEHAKSLHPFNILGVYDEPIGSYYLRHNARFEAMHRMGQWELMHPWYECFVPTKVLLEHLTQLLHDLPLHYANVIHVVPIAKYPTGFLMLPEEESICSFMILNPGVPFALKDSCMEAIQKLDAFFFAQGGKRYLSGFLGMNVKKSYWSKHFGEQYASWHDLKKHYDPSGIFCSLLHQGGAQ